MKKGKVKSRTEANDGEDKIMCYVIHPGQCNGVEREASDILKRSQLTVDLAERGTHNSLVVVVVLGPTTF